MREIQVTKDEICNTDTFVQIQLKSNDNMRSIKDDCKLYNGVLSATNPNQDSEYPRVFMYIYLFYTFIAYSDSQKHESSCLFSDRFWCLSPEPFELRKIFFPIIASLFKKLSDKKGTFQIGAKIHLILRKTLIFQRKSQLLKKIRHFEKFFMDLKF